MAAGTVELESFHVYVENIQRGPVGNSALWWRRGDCGYTCDLREAAKFRTDSPILLDLMRSGKYRAWKCEYIEKHTMPTVDVDQLESKFALTVEACNA